MEDAIKYYKTNKSTYIHHLKELVKIPSISFSGYEPTTINASAQYIYDFIKNMNATELELIHFEDCPRPYIFAHWFVDKRLPTVILYAHHDVQPVGDKSKWKSDPFEPIELDGRLYGRGAADDKAGVLIELASIDSYLKSQKTLPINIKVLYEGEEEIGSPYLDKFLNTYKEKLKADYLIICDTENFDVGIPCITTGLRGIISFEVELQSLKQSLHSGLWGGPIPDPALILTKLISGIADEKGQILIKEITDQVKKDMTQIKELKSLNENDLDFRKKSGLLDSVELLKGENGFIFEKIWYEPTFTVNAIQANSRQSAAGIINEKAWAKMSFRLVPDMDKDLILTIIQNYFEKNTPLGLQLNFKCIGKGNWWKSDRSSSVYSKMGKSIEESWGRPPLFIGCGASIPFVEPFIEALDGAPAILIGIEDPYSNAHSENESLHIETFHKTVESLIRFFNNLAN